VNRKVLAFILLLSLVSLLVGPVVSAKEEEEPKTELTWFKWHEPGFAPEWTNTAPSKGDILKFFAKGHCDVDYYRLNVGGYRGPVEIPGTNYWTYGIVGGTTYRQFIDFNYEGKLSSKTEYYKNGELKSLTVSIIGTYSFDPESPNHEIDGTIKFYSRSTLAYHPDGSFDKLTGGYNGHGTGDLEGVVIKDSGESTWLYDHEFGEYPAGFFSYGVVAGTVKGWPTHLNTPPPTAYIHIEHPWIGSLEVDIGVGDPFNPTWSQRIWNHGGGSTDNLDLFVDLSAAVQYLPPDETNVWFIKVGNWYYTGEITEFTITYLDTVYSSTDPPVLIDWYGTSYAYIPS